MKKLIVLLLAALMLVSAALAEDYSALTTEEFHPLQPCPVWGYVRPAGRHGRIKSIK